VDLSVAVEDLEGEGGPWTLVRVGGELDVATAPRLREQLLTAIADGGPHLVLDLGDVDFLDSTGLGVIVGVLKRARTLGGDLRLVCPTPAIRKVFEITALDRTMPLADTVDEALAGVAGG
jgi:anti-sigma B factor antagonist